MRLRTLIVLATSVVVTLSLSACPGGVDKVASGNAPIELASENTPAEPPSENTPTEPATGYTIGGTAAGLAPGTRLTLLNNGADALTVSAAGPFTFASRVPANGSYSVTVADQPEGQTCSVANHSGAGVTANVSSVRVVCSAVTHTIGGTVSGLAPNSRLVLNNNGSEALEVAANGVFTFATPVPENGSYAVTIGTQPAGQTCSVAGYTGTGVTANVASVQVTCAANTHTIGGTVSGLASGTQVTLANNGGDALTVTANGAFTFATPVPDTGSYAVTIGTRPIGQTCSVSGGSGTGVAANVASVSIACVAPVYVANFSDNTVSQYAVGADGALTPLIPATVAAGTGSGSVTIDPTGKYAYVANYNGNNVSQYAIGADGALTPLSHATVPAGINPKSVAVDFTGRYAYVANSGDNTISQYSVGSDGTLTPLSPATVAARPSPGSVNVDPTGRYAYVGNVFGERTISQYSVGSDGTLTPLNPATVAASITPALVTVDPTGKYAYVGNFGGNTISQYSVGADGTLTPLNPATVAASTSPTSVTVDPTGKYAYVANYDGNNVSQYAIGADGALTPLSPATMPAGTHPYSVAVDATGRYAYVTDVDDEIVLQYAIGAGGALTPLSPDRVAAGGSPTAIATLR
jgi:6-phosphogluconolactonase (cycloisomerase 2 family)